MKGAVQSVRHLGPHAPEPHETNAEDPWFQTISKAYLTLDG